MKTVLDPILSGRPMTAEFSTATVCGRCLFRNQCLVIRLLGLPAGLDVAPCFQGCCGQIVVSHGQVAIESNGARHTLAEGGAWALPESGGFRLWADHTADVIFLECSQNHPSRTLRSSRAVPDLALPLLA